MRQKILTIFWQTMAVFFSIHDVSSIMTHSNDIACFEKSGSGICTIFDLTDALGF